MIRIRTEYALFFFLLLFVFTGLNTNRVCSAAPVCLSGTVSDDMTGFGLDDVYVAFTRVSILGPGTPDDEIPIEAAVETDGTGYYELMLDDATPGLDELLVYTLVLDYTNEIYDNVQFAGQYPTYGDIGKPGVKPVDMSSGVSGIDFALESRKTTVMVAMTDGTCLATDIYLPEGTGSWPVVLYRTPYGKNSDHPTLFFNDYGYVVVAQDCRGRFDSEGEDHVFYDDGWGDNKDGFDTCSWIMAQPWCNGKIGTMGSSARGITQNMLAGSLPSGLVCQHVGVAASNMYSQAMFQGGSFRKALIENWLEGQGSLDYLDEIVTRPNYDDVFWPFYNPETRHHLVDVPIVNYGGWYDIFLQGTINNFVNIQHNGLPGSTGNQKLIIEPYGHGLGDGGFYWPAGAPPMLSASSLNWFDYWIKGINNGVMDEPAVCYYMLGDVDDLDGPGNEWRFADDWPVPGWDTKLYFHTFEGLSTVPPGGPEFPNTYVYDPLDPVPTIGGANLTITKGPYDQSSIESRPDVLLYTSQTLTQHVEITGKVLIRLFASSSALDTDFTGKLCDVYPDGRSMLVCDGVIRARHRDSFSSEELMDPGVIYEFEIDLWEMALAFNVGHKIRVAISSSNDPRFDPNPNTGEPFRQQTHTVPATNTIYHDFEHPSHLQVRVTGPDSNSDGIPDIADLDNDGLPDEFEWLIVYFDPDDDITGIEDVLPGDDFDGDGFTNYEEFLNGTDPTQPDNMVPAMNATSVLLLLSLITLSLMGKRAKPGIRTIDV